MASQRGNSDTRPKVKQEVLMEHEMDYGHNDELSARARVRQAAVELAAEAGFGPGQSVSAPNRMEKSQM